MQDVLRWGILGASRIAQDVIVPAIQRSSNGIVSAIASRSSGRAALIAGGLGVERAYGSYHELLVDPEIDAVYISLPNTLHAEWAMNAARAGKAILCEKPLTTDVADGERLVSFCEQHGVPLLDAFMYRFHPQTQLVHELISAGTIGAVQEVHAHLSVDLSRAHDSHNIRFQRALGGGALLDMGCYTIDVVLGVLGRLPKRVSGLHFLDPMSGVDLATTALMDFGAGQWAQVSCSFRAGGQGFYKIVGSDGAIEVPRGIIPGLGERVADALVTQIDEKGARFDHTLAPADQYRLMLEAFAGAVLERYPLPYSARRSVDVLRVVAAIQRSASEGQLVELNQ